MESNDNPFAVLGATTRDRKARLIELTEDAALHGDHDAAVAARNLLSSPRTRLAAEVAWFPGVSPKRVAEVRGAIQRGEWPDLSSMPALCRANFGAEALAVCADDDSESLRLCIEELSVDSEEFDAIDVMKSINEDRQAAGIPEVNELGGVEDLLAERIRHFERLLTARLDQLPSADMVEVYRSVVSWSTGDGEHSGHRLVGALIDRYELKSSSFLSSESERIIKLAEDAKAAADRKVPERQVRASVNEIINALRRWDLVAQPIQLAYQGRGLDHDESQVLARTVRGLGIHLFNKHDYLEDAKLLSSALQELFAEVFGVNDQLQADSEALDDISAGRAEGLRREQKDKEEFEREITYETSFGTFFKDRFRISPDGFDYKGVLMPLEDVTGVRWGAVRNSVNGVPTGTDYFFSYGGARQTFDLKPNERQYSEITKRAWRAVCINILLRWMEEWSNGRNVQIGGVTVSDQGMFLRRSRFFQDDEVKFFGWGDLTKVSQNGFLEFRGHSDRRFAASFSYKDAWNVHVLDFAIEKVWSGKPSLSRIFGG